MFIIRASSANHLGIMKMTTLIIDASFFYRFCITNRTKFGSKPAFAVKGALPPSPSSGLAPMDHTEASNRLKALASGSPARSLSARLNDLMPDIDHAMRNGVPRTEILKALSESGIEVKMSYFNIVRNRIKKKQSTKDQSRASKDFKDIPVATASSNITAEKEQSIYTEKSSSPDKIEANDSVKQANTSVSRFRNQFVDLAALAKLAPKS